VAESAARAQVAEAWGVVGLPDAPGRPGAGGLPAAPTGPGGALLVGGVDAADLADPRSEEALAKTFVVSLDYRPSSVTEVADVVLPVAPHAEKGGTFVDWEGRARTFQAALDTAAQSDYRVLDMLASEMGAFLGARTLAEVRAEMTGLGPWSGARPSVPEVPVGEVPSAGDGEAVLATWHHLLDEGSLQAGEPFLAGTAARPVARVSAATAEACGLADGADVVVSLGAERITLPLVVTEGMVDHVVWLPTNSQGSRVRTPGGAVVGLSPAPSSSQTSEVSQ
jgi:NADH-quinone oxidoreductase subunit G